MPFDAATASLILARAPVTDPTTLYRERREKAAALWRMLPPENLNMEHWECGSTACALGWLADHQFDGWSPGQKTMFFGRVPTRPNGRSGIGAAREYFALDYQEAKNIFGGGHATARAYGYSDVTCVTPSDVADRLLAMPYTLPEGE